MRLLEPQCDGLSMTLLFLQPAKQALAASVSVSALLGKAGRTPSLGGDFITTRQSLKDHSLQISL